MVNLVALADSYMTEHTAGGFRSRFQVKVPGQEVAVGKATIFFLYSKYKTTQ